MKFRIFFVLLLVALVSSCKVEFNPNASWKDVPSIYCVLDIQEDTVWARVQRCYLGEDNLYNYSHIFDSNNYKEGDIQVHLLAWQGVVNASQNFAITATDRLVDRWELTYTEVPGKPDGNFSSEPQPMYYCVPGARTLKADSSCVFELVVLKSATGDTLATARTAMVGFIPLTIREHDTSENVVKYPNGARGKHFGFIPVNKQNEIRWNALPRARLYQTSVRFYYRKGGDTLSILVPGPTVKNPYNYSEVGSTGLTQRMFLEHIAKALKDNTDSLFNVNFVDVVIYACNEDLNAYMTSQNAQVTPGQEFQAYSNVEGGMGIFGSRRTHIEARVPCDSNGRPDYLPDVLKNLGVGFYGSFSD